MRQSSQPEVPQTPIRDHEKRCWERERTERPDDGPHAESLPGESDQRRHDELRSLLYKQQQT